MGASMAPPGGLPHFPVRLDPPDLGPWRAGNGGVPGFWTFRGTAPGPHVLVVSLIHGNELAGALVLAGLLRRQARGVLAAHRRHGLRLERTLHEGDWATLVLRAPGRGVR